MPAIEITGVPKGQDIFEHQPVAASKLGFISQQMIVGSYKGALERLEEKLDTKKAAQEILEDFIEGIHVSGSRIMKSLPELSQAAKGDEALQQALGLMVHHTLVEPVARGAAERLMHLAHQYEGSKNKKLGDVTQAYSTLYQSVLAYEKELVSGHYEQLDKLAADMDKQVKAHAPLLADYGRNIIPMYSNPYLAQREQEVTKNLYQDITGETLTLPPAVRASAARR
jgi:hypothetical protein